MGSEGTENLINIQPSVLYSLASYLGERKEGDPRNEGDRSPARAKLGEKASAESGARCGVRCVTGGVICRTEGEHTGVGPFDLED